jgi:hypothetical protein
MTTPSTPFIEQTAGRGAVRAARGGPHSRARRGGRGGGGGRTRPCGRGVE